MSRACIPARCRRCRADILVGLDSHLLALTATTDPAPLSRTGELLAVCQGRRVYSLDLNRWLNYRDAWRLAQPARGTVVAEHRCGEHIPATWRQQPPPKQSTHNTQEVPY